MTTQILFPIIPADDFPEWWQITPDIGDMQTMADHLAGRGMPKVDLLARDYGHDDNYESDDMGACASWYRLTDGMRVAYTLASGDAEIVGQYAYVRSDDYGFWDVCFADSQSQVEDWLAMWADNNVPLSDDDLAEDGETVLTENAKEWEGWDDFLGSYIACAFWSSSDRVLRCDCGGLYGPTVRSAMGNAPVKWCKDCGRVCAYWDEEDLEDIMLDEYFDRDDLSADALKKIEDDCSEFMFYNYAKLSRVGNMGQHGHDFWLTRNRHGAGFWDRGYGDLGKDLTDKAQEYGSSDLYIGDDGKVEAL